jgi:hypothetical protein
MWQQSEIEAQDGASPRPAVSQEQTPELALLTDVEQAPPSRDVFRAEALQHYINQRREAVSPIDTTMRFSLLLWLLLAALLLSMVVLGILLVVLAGVPVLGLGKAMLAI